jgi:hypothetical protein
MLGLSYFTFTIRVPILKHHTDGPWDRDLDQDREATSVR